MSYQIFKKYFQVISIFLSFIFVIYSPILSAKDNIHFYGALVAEPCVLTPENQEIQLGFGNIPDKYLYQNERTSSRSFQIHLTDCSLDIAQTVSIEFTGKENLYLKGLLSIDPASAATGFGIGLEDSKGNFIPLNKYSQKFHLIEGNNYFQFQAFLQGEPDAIKNRKIESGIFKATVSFILSYQ